MRVSFIAGLAVLTLGLSVSVSASYASEDCTGRAGTAGQRCLVGGGGPGGVGGGGGAPVPGFWRYAWPSCSSSLQATLNCIPTSVGWFIGTTTPGFYVSVKECCASNKSLYAVDTYYNNQYVATVYRCMTQAECDAL